MAYDASAKPNPAPEAGGQPVTYVEAGAGDAGQRLDNYLLRVLKGVPRTHVYRLLRKGEEQDAKSIREWSSFGIPPERDRYKTKQRGMDQQQNRAGHEMYC